MTSEGAAILSPVRTAQLDDPRKGNPSPRKRPGCELLQPGPRRAKVDWRRPLGDARRSRYRPPFAWILKRGKRGRAVKRRRLDQPGRSLPVPTPTRAGSCAARKFFGPIDRISRRCRAKTCASASTSNLLCEAIVALHRLFAFVRKQSHRLSRTGWTTDSIIALIRYAAAVRNCCLYPPPLLMFPERVCGVVNDSGTLSRV